MDLKNSTIYASLAIEMRIKDRLATSGYFMAFLATIIWSGNFIVARGLSSTFSPISISFFRWLIATLVILPLAWPYLKKDLPLLKKQWKLMMVLAFLGVTMFNTLIYAAAHWTPALNLSLIAITAPLYVVLLNRILFKELLSKQQIIGFIVLLIGLITLLSKGDLSLLLQLKFNKGDLTMALAACLFASYTALVRKKDSRIGNLSFVAATFILGELILLPMFLAEQILLPTQLTFTARSLYQLIYIGVGPSVISFYLWNKSIVLIGSTKAATIYNTLPIYSAFFAAMILHEAVLTVQIISSIVIVAGVLLVIRAKKA